MDELEIYVQNLKIEDFSAFGATAAELLSYALDEVGLLGSHTLINGKSARQLGEGFYTKRHKVRQNTRLGNLLISDGVLTQAQLIEALSYHVTHEMPLGASLIQLGFCTQAQLDQALARQASMRRHME
jgi:hypothetical protein